jgi:ABC-2 type transport system permease protein
MSVSAPQLIAVIGALFLGAAASSVLGLLVAAPLESVENFAGVINVVLFPLLFLSGALYPTARMPFGLRTVARLNPVSYAVDLTRAALGQPSEFDAASSILALVAVTVFAFLLSVFLFDPEQRFVSRRRAARG